MTPQIIDYTLLYDVNPGTLIEEVREFMHKGWQPLGSVVVATGQEPGYGTDYQFTQAMVKYADTPAEHHSAPSAQSRIPIPGMEGCWRYRDPDRCGAYFNCPCCKSERRFFLCGPRRFRCQSCRHRFGG